MSACCFSLQMRSLEKSLREDIENNFRIFKDFFSSLIGNDVDPWESRLILSFLFSNLAKITFQPHCWRPEFLQGMLQISERERDHLGRSSFRHGLIFLSRLAFHWHLFEVSHSFPLVMGQFRNESLTMSINNSLEVVEFQLPKKFLRSNGIRDLFRYDDAEEDVGGNSPRGFVIVRRSCSCRRLLFYADGKKRARVFIPR